MNMVKRIPKRRQTNSRGELYFIAVLAILFITIVVGIGYIFYQQVRAWAAGSDLLPSPNQSSGNSGIDWQPGEPIPTWEGKERVNILVMGIDARPGEEGPWRPTQ
jgi:hypothetical protein